MKTCAAACVLAGLSCAWPTPALAQRMPAQGSAAVGGEFGVFLPAQDELGPGLALDGFYEYYLTPRTSVRTGLGWANPDFDRESEDSLRHIRVAVDAVYNWEGGTIHPFVGAGIGIYFLQLRDNGRSVGDSESETGGALFGGMDFFNTRTVSIKGELRYHVIGDVRGLNPDGASLMIGLKKYF